MHNSEGANTQSTRSAKRSLDYLNAAQCAQQEGNDSLAQALYLAAYHSAVKEGVATEDVFIEGIKQAWFLATTNKQRTLAEYLFTIIEPYLSQDELNQYAIRLQDLAFEKLEQFGVERHEIEQALDGVRDAAKEIVPHVLEHHVSHEDNNATSESDSKSRSSASSTDSGTNSTDSASSTSASSTSASSTDKPKRNNAHNDKEDEPAAVTPEILPFLSQLFQGVPGTITAFGIPAPGQKAPAPQHRLTYANMPGFETAINRMHSLGIGIQNNPELKKFITFLNEQHGLSGVPVPDAFVFRAAAREDASHFMEATLGEIGLPGMRIQVDENVHGDVVLCVMAQSGAGIRLNSSKGLIDGSGVLLLEDIDLWGHLLPFDECFDESCSYAGPSGLSRGAYEAARLIRSAIENPDVYVLATCSNEANTNEGIFYVLEPFTVIDIDNPNTQERAMLWKDLMKEHPSLRNANLQTLVACSEEMPRFDIYMAAREAVEESYKNSLAAKEYCPLSTADVCEKLALYQPLDSQEYRTLEEHVIRSFRHELDTLDEFFEHESNDENNSGANSEK